MSEENVTKILQMISAAGTSRAKYVEAIRASKISDFEKAEALMREGGECFKIAHEVHSEFLASASADLAATGSNADINLILIHAEDQMMCAETFRLVAEELIDVYKNMRSQG